MTIWNFSFSTVFQRAEKLISVTNMPTIEPVQFG